MGVQPPSDGIEEGPEVVEFGIAALDAALESRDVSFPVEAEELASRHGDVSVPVDAAGHETTLREVLAESPREEFTSEQELLEALHPIFEAKREAVSRSLLARIRGLVPF